MSKSTNAHPEMPREHGISLEELTAAFAQAMGTAPQSRGEVEDRPEVEPVPDADAAHQPDTPGAAAASTGAQTEDDSCCPISPRSILEAMLFVGNRDGQPLSSGRAAELMRDVEPAEIARLVDELNERYAANGCPYHIVSEGSGFRLTLRNTFHPLQNRFFGRIREARLSQAAIDVLAVVAYQQPLTADQVGRLRGKPSGHVLAQLVRRGLLRIERTQSPRRTARYFTTDRFLQLFSLESLADLPQSEDLA